MIIKAIQKIRPNAQWNLNGNNYDGLIWLDQTQSKPTEAEINQAIVEIQAEEAANAYKALRKSNYPDIGDQLDALWKGGQAAQDMLAQINAVKAQFPKPE